ncbi:cation-transporting P-type ATPase [Flavobacteriaceae bacterium GF1]
MIDKPFSVSFQRLAELLNSDLTRGLDENETQRRLKLYGANEIPKDRPKKKWGILLDQLFNPIFYILISAAILAFILGEWLDGTAILIVILISTMIGFFMELQALRSLESLRKIGQPTASVLRNGELCQVKTSKLVPGDLLVLQGGDVVAADARLLFSEDLLVREAALTGESAAISKKTGAIPVNTAFIDQNNMVFRGTVITSGFGKAIIVATGKHTQLGQIQQLAATTKKERTPLEKKLNQFSTWLIWLTLTFIALIIFFGYWQGKDLFLMIETGVALAVAAIPEGLPVVATIALAKGMLRLSKKQVVIKKLEAVQTLGATNIICTDKTGTLTEDKMKVHTLVLEDIVMESVSSQKQDWQALIKKWQALERLLFCSVLCNNAGTFIGNLGNDSIEEALVGFATGIGFDPSQIRRENSKIWELPFDAERKLMVTAHQNKKDCDVYVKGAFEQVITHCNTIIKDNRICTLDNKETWNGKVDEIASQGLRVLAFAHKKTQKRPQKESALQNLTFLGFVGFVDPAREDVKQTIGLYKKAGIKVVMVTGDHPNTAKKIAQEIGLVKENTSTGNVLNGKALDKAQNLHETHSKELLATPIFARVTPKQKLDLISLYQSNNNIVGMIGDGINDVPALKKADIGIAMGIRGTEAAREAADVILKNDKFTAIELGIRQGRVIFYNIRQFVMYLLSCNLSEILSVGAAALANLPAPLLPLQILFLNLITDIFPALALGLGKGEKDIMYQSPKNPKEPIMNRLDWVVTITYGLSISVMVLGIVGYAHFVLDQSPEIINNMAFYTLVLAQLLNVFNMPKRRSSFFRNEVTKNPWVWGAIVLSLLIIFVAYLIKPVALALSMQALSPELLWVVVVFSFGSLFLSQTIKYLVTLFTTKAQSS